METVNFDHLQEYQNQGYPLIFFDRPCDITESSNVIIDDFKVSFEATEHLIHSGCRHIVYFSGPQTLTLYANRVKGYKAALEKHGIPVNENYIYESKLMEEDGVAGAKKILSMPEVDGVFSANDTSAISAMQYLKENGKRIPEDVAFVGFNNEPIASVFEPGLTTVSQPDFEMGKIASTMLFEQIKNNSELKTNETKILQSELIVRKSTRII